MFKQTAPLFLLLLVIAALTVSAGGLAHARAASGPADDTPGTMPCGPDFSKSQKQSHREAARELLAGLEDALAAGSTVFRVPPGDYLFDEPGAPGFHLHDRNGLTIEADGATFWFGPNQGVRLENCSDVRLSGLTIDSDQLPWTQGVIEELDPEAGTLVLRVCPGYRVFEGDALREKLRILFFDPETRRELPVFDDWVLELESAGDQRLKVARFDSARVFRDPVPGRPVRVGDLTALLITYGNGANVHLENCADITLENITIHASSGFAFHETNGDGGNHYLGCRIVRRPETDRLMAARADGFHSYMMRKGPLIENCEFSHTGDDLLNIHGFFSVVLEVLTESEILVAAPFGRNFEPGATLDFVPADGYGDAKVAVILDMDELTDPDSTARAAALPETLREQWGLQMRNFPKPAVFRVRLDRPGVAELHDLVSSPTHAGAGAIIRDSHFHDGHVRGLLLKTEDTLVERNRIERTGHGGIVLEPSGYWLEGPFPRRIHILDNSLSETGRASFNSSGMSASNAAIQVGNHFGKRLFPFTLSQGANNRDIEIRRNLIHRPFGFAILVTNAANITIADNSITAPFAGGEHPAYYDFSSLPDPRLHVPHVDKDILSDVRFPILLIEARNVVLDANTCKDAPPFVRGIVGTVLTKPE